MQSHVRAHAELTWVLNCVASFGELRRMTQFKDKSAQQGEGGIESLSVGFFDYPVLMVSDILLYDTAEVPVGDDQRQHVELARDVAIRFNSRFGDTFVVPKATFPAVGARVMDLQQPERKMSKSEDSPQGTILVLDPPKTIEKKIKSAVTDSGSEVRHDRDDQARRLEPHRDLRRGHRAVRSPTSSASSTASSTARSRSRSPTPSSSSCGPCRPASRSSRPTRPRSIAASRARRRRGRGHRRSGARRRVDRAAGLLPRRALGQRRRARLLPGRGIGEIGRAVVLARRPRRGRGPTSSRRLTVPAARRTLDDDGLRAAPVDVDPDADAGAPRGRTSLSCGYALRRLVLRVVVLAGASPGRGRR